jgi:hypothetical protein
MRKIVLIAALLASTPALAAFAEIDAARDDAARKAHDACYDKADLALDACTKPSGIGYGAMSVCERAHTNAKADCDKASTAGWDVHDILTKPIEDLDCYTAFGLDACAKSGCDSVHTNAKAVCGKFAGSDPAYLSLGVSEMGYAPDKDGNCPDGYALNTSNRCLVGSMFAHDPCYSGPKNQFNQASCDKLKAENAASDARHAAQLEASKAQERQDKLNACSKMPTTYGVIMCRWGV